MTRTPLTTLHLKVIRSLVEHDCIVIDKALVVGLLETLDAYIAWSHAWQRIAQTGDLEAMLAELSAERAVH